MNRPRVLRTVALCALTCPLLVSLSFADPPPPNVERGLITPCHALVGPVFCFRVTDIEGVASDRDRFRIEFEMVNWTSTDARRLILTLNTARRPGQGLPPGAPFFADAIIDEDGRPMTGAPEPPTGNLPTSNQGSAELIGRTRIEFTADIPTTDCACADLCVGCVRGILDPNLGFRDDKCCVCALLDMIPGSVNEGGSPPLIKANDPETIDDGPNVTDGFVIEIDDWDPREEISFNWHMETQSGEVIGMIAPGGNTVGNEFGFGTLNLARLVGDAPPPLLSKNTGYDPPNTRNIHQDNPMFWAENQVEGRDQYFINPIPSGEPGAGSFFGIEMGAAVTDEFANQDERDFRFEGKKMSSDTNMFACTETPEACCLPRGDCLMIDPSCCADQGGNPRGPASDCDDLPEVRGDMNFDRDVDADDFARFAVCFSGPNEINPPRGCSARDFVLADLDCDSDVDLDDFDFFQTAFGQSP